MIRPTLILLAAGTALAASPAAAAVLVYTASLTGGHEVPPAASPGTGSAVVTIDDVADTMRVQVNFSGLVGNTAASHIHCCQPLGTNAQVATTTHDLDPTNDSASATVKLGNGNGNGN